jgi:signal transduction histidine kinase
MQIDGGFRGYLGELSESTRHLWRLAVPLLLFTVVFAAWVLIRPANQATVEAVDEAFSVLGPLAGVFLCFDSAFWPRLRRELTTPRAVARVLASSAVPIALGLGIFLFTLGEAGWVFYEYVLNQPQPFPSWCDAAFLAAYPFLLLGILQLARSSTSTASRAEVVLDSVTIMIAMVTFSWYFVLGPNLFQAKDSLMAVCVGTAYPLFDIVLVGCVLMLWVRGSDPALRPAMTILALGLSVIVVTDSVFDWLNLHNAYQSPALVDVGWPLGYMLVGLGCRAALPALRCIDSTPDVVRNGSGVARAAMPLRSLWRTASWRALLPYCAIPFMLALLGYVWIMGPRTDNRLDVGVYVGMLAFIAFVALRQLIATLENGALSRQLGISLEQAQRLHESERAARKAAEAAATMRDRVLAAASHDLRTPLTTIMNQLERIQLRLKRGHGVEPDWLAKQVETASGASDRMLAIVEEITDAVRLQAGKELTLNLCRVDFSVLVESTVSMVRAASTWPGAPAIELATGGELWVEGDPARLGRVIQNLVGNAVKYSPLGTPITVETRAEGPWATTVVSDRGVGIPADEVPRLCTHFFRASTAVGIPGTGIGLAGSYQIVQQHGGQTAIESALGQGTTVTVRLPLCIEL